MKFTLAIAAIAAAVAVSAQSITDLPQCALSCFIEGASGSGCASIADINCQCQAATQLIVAGISGPCLLNSTCSPAEIASASVVGSSICATVSQTALPATSELPSSTSVLATSTSVLATSTSVLATSTSVLATSTSVLATSSAVAPASSSPTSTTTATVVATSTSTAVASSSVATLPTSTTIAVTTASAASSAVVPVTQITDGQIQATTATVAPYSGAAAALATAGVEALLAAAGVAVFAL